MADDDLGAAPDHHSLDVAAHPHLPMPVPKSVGCRFVRTGEPAQFSGNGACESRPGARLPSQPLERARHVSCGSVAKNRPESMNRALSDLEPRDLIDVQSFMWYIASVCVK